MDDGITFSETIGGYYTVNKQEYHKYMERNNIRLKEKDELISRLLTIIENFSNLK